MKQVFEGSAVAIITPFKNGAIDFASFEKLLQFQLDAKTDAIVVLGTTGEPATISDKDKKEIILFAKSKINGKSKLIVGTGANSTRKAIENSIVAKECGADALLVVTPYYNKCTQKGLIDHFKMIALATHLPIIAYNVPGRTGVNITPNLAVELSKIDEVCGIKEASGNISQIVELCKVLNGKMAVYSGDDALNYTFMTLGGKGCISVTANIMPKEVKQVVDLCKEGKFDLAKNLHETLLEINKTMFVEVNPVPVKYACHLLNLCESEIRLPLSTPNEESIKKIKSTLKNYKLI